MNHAAPPHDRADASLRDEQLRLIIDSAKEYAIITLDLEGRVTSWNTGAELILGYTETEILGRKADVFFTPEDRAAGAPEREECLAREDGRAANERWHLRKDGSRFWGSGVMLPLSDGRGYLKIFRDRTDERLAEERLQARTAELEAVLATVPVAVWFTYDPDAHHAVGNRQAAALMRQAPAGNVSLTAPESERPRHFRVFRDGAEADPATLPLQRAARGEEAESEEQEIRFSDGSAITVLVQARPLRSGDGRVIGAVCTAVDITERKRFEEALKDSEEKFRQLADNIPALA